jgi:hypothetical protein
MKKFTVLSLVSAAALIVAPVVFAQGVVDGNTNPYHVAGEKLDSGLGNMTAYGAPAKNTVARSF